MLQKIILGTVALSAIGTLAVGCSSGGDFAAEDETAEAALGSDQLGCPALVVRRQMLTGGTTTLTVSGVQASIINKGSTIRCGTNATGTFIVGSWIDREYFMSNPNTRITKHGNYLEFSPALPSQATPEGPPTGPIGAVTCLYNGATLEGSGFPSVPLPLTTVWNVDRHPEKNRVIVSCMVTTPNPLALTTARPKDVIATSGDDFIFRCDLTGAARTNACRSVCNGNAQCIANCDTSAGCSPILCEGSDCPGQSCAPENRCSVASDCGAPSRFTCTNGCCLTIIR